MSDTPPASPPPAAQASRGAIVTSIFAQVVFLLALAAAAIIAWYKQDYTLLTAMAGVAATNATTVVGYWVGSSSGNAQPPKPSA